MSNLAHKFLLRVITFILGVLFVGAPKLFAAPTLPPTSVQVGAERMDQLLPLLRGKRVGLVSNHTGVIGTDQRPLVDSLLALNIEVCRLFSPEHGFRGTANAGASVASGKDALTGLPIISLYGNNKKPKHNQIADLDLILFDLQDVGTRFYTYISTMHYVMEAAAEAHITVVILDRPNPNDYIDGPLLTPSCQSFIGMHPIPVLHGLTVGELALMINGERWLAGGIQCDLRVVPIKGWQHGDSYTLPVAPSPNLKTPEAIRLYPSLCFFEATILSVGRGTPNPFTALGYPNKELGEYLFTPKSMQGATDAKYKGQRCYGTNYTDSLSQGGLSIAPLIDWKKRTQKVGKRLIDREHTFDLLAGSPSLRKQLREGWSEEAIRKSWQEDLRKYRALRQQYLIYKDNRPETKP